jgi:hypothetical protein
MKLQFNNVISDSYYSFIIIPFPLSVNIESAKSEYEMNISEETVFMKWPELESVIFNPINLFLLFIDPLIDNVEHD